MIEAANSTDLSKELIHRYNEDCEIRGMSPESLREAIQERRSGEG
jgi:hypothetical protein